METHVPYFRCTSFSHSVPYLFLLNFTLFPSFTLLFLSQVTGRSRNVHYFCYSWNSNTGDQERIFQCRLANEQAKCMMMLPKVKNCTSLKLSPLHINIRALICIHTCNYTMNKVGSNATCLSNGYTNIFSADKIDFTRDIIALMVVISAVILVAFDGVVNCRSCSIQVVLYVL